VLDIQSVPSLLNILSVVRCLSIVLYLESGQAAIAANPDSYRPDPRIPNR
jgi:hypothetical protein